MKYCVDVQVDFGCILNDTEAMQVVKVTNESPMDVKYQWSFIDSAIQFENKEEDEGLFISKFILSYCFSLGALRPPLSGIGKCVYGFCLLPYRSVVTVFGKFWQELRLTPNLDWAIVDCVILPSGCFFGFVPLKMLKIMFWGLRGSYFFRDVLELNYTKPKPF